MTTTRRTRRRQARSSSARSAAAVCGQRNRAATPPARQPNPATRRPLTGSWPADHGSGADCDEDQADEGQEKSIEASRCAVHTPITPLSASLTVTSRRGLQRHGVELGLHGGLDLVFGQSDARGGANVDLHRARRNHHHDLFAGDTCGHAGRLAKAEAMTSSSTTMATRGLAMTCRARRPGNSPLPQKNQAKQGQQDSGGTQQWRGGGPGSRASRWAAARGCNSQAGWPSAARVISRKA